VLPPFGLAKIDFGPLQSGDLIFALSGQDQQLENAFVRRDHRTGAAPHRPQLALGQDTLTHYASPDQPPRFKVAER
jgi:hypothetical protein